MARTAEFKFLFFSIAALFFLFFGSQARADTCQSMNNTATAGDFSCDVAYSDSGGSGLGTCSYYLESNGARTADKPAVPCINSSPASLLISVGAEPTKDCHDNGQGTCKLFVKAEDKAGNLLFDQWLATFNIQFVAPPAAPSNLSGASVCAGPNQPNVALTWTDNSDNEDGFKIYRDNTLLKSLAANTTAYTDTTPSPGAANYYEVRAYNSAGDSASVASSVSVGACEPTFILKPASAAVPVGGTQQLDGEYDPDGPNGSAASQPVSRSLITWSSLNASVATVNASGLATGVAGGLATIQGVYSGITAITARATIRVASLSVGLTASPSSGIAPLNGVSLTAGVSGTAVGPISYQFDCIYDGKESWDFTSNGGTCNYPSAGTFLAKVRVARDVAIPADATVKIVVDTAPSVDSNNYGVWKNSDIAIAITPSTNGGSAIAETRYSWDVDPINAACSSGGNIYTASMTLSAEGTHKLYMCARNQAGLAGANNRTYYLDKTSPGTTVQCNGADCSTDWYAADVAITFVCSDKTGGSGCDKTYACLDQDNTCDPAVYTSFNVAKEGVNYVRFYSMDQAGNQEKPTKSQTVKLDKTAPVSSIAYPAAGNWQRMQFPVGASDLENGSGLDTCYFDAGVKASAARSCLGAPFSVNVGQTGDCQVQGYNTCAVSVWAKDKAGNVGSKTSRSFSIDYTPPVNSIVSPPTSSWQKADFPVSISDSDSGGSGLSVCFRHISDSVYGWRSYFAIRTCNAVSSVTVGSANNCLTQGKDACAVYAFSYDIAGNLSNVTIRTFSIDYTAPTITDFRVNGQAAGTVVNAPAATVTWAASDGANGSGIDHYELWRKPDGGAWKKIADPAASGLTDTPPAGVWWYGLHAVDVAGNVGYEPAPIKLVTDNTPPTVSVSGAPANWQNADASAAVSCSDSGSGCDSATYRLETAAAAGSCSLNYSNYTLISPQIVSSDLWICASAKDKMGNIGFSPSPVEFKVDKTAPESLISSPGLNAFKGARFPVGVIDIDTGGSSADPSACNYSVRYCSSPPCPPGFWTPSLTDQTRTCSSDTPDITVGQGGNCPAEGLNACRIIAKSKDKAANPSIPSSALDLSGRPKGIIDISIDLTDPVVDKIYCGGDYTIPCASAKQGTSQTFKALVSDNVQISNCYFYSRPAGSLSWTAINNLNFQDIACPSGLLGKCYTASKDYAFSSFGNYEMRAYCWDGAGHTKYGETTAILVQENHAPQIGFGPNFSPSPCDQPTTQPGCNVNFLVSATDADSDPLTYSWNFGDGNSSSTQNPSYHYTTAGNYTAQVVVSDGRGGTAVKSLSVSVTNPTLSVVLTANPISGTTQTKFDLQASVSGTMFGKITYRFNCTTDPTWDYVFPDDSDNPKTVVAACDYLRPDTYTAEVSIDRGTGSAYATAIITVSANLPPQAVISSSGDAYTKANFTLNNDSTDPNGDIKISKWTIKQGSQVIHQLSCNLNNPFCPWTLPPFLPAGAYTAQLYVEDSFGASDMAIKKFSLKQDIIADFDCSLDNSHWQACDSQSFRPVKGATVYFRDRSQPSEGVNINIVSRFWRKDGVAFPGLGPNDANPLSIIQGTLIELRAADSAGRTSSQQHTITTRLPLPQWQEISPF